MNKLFPYLLLIFSVAFLFAGNASANGSSQNYDNCRVGNQFSCDISLLTDAQKESVHLAALARNYVNCREGNQFSCDKSLLSEAQKESVHLAALDRNYDNCREGNQFSCDKSLLTEAQKESVHLRALARNYVNCREGNQFSCDKSLLSEAQKESVHLAALDRNYDNCRVGNQFSCDISLLTEAQKVSTLTGASYSSSTPSHVKSSVNQLVSPRTFCAENGSCYGDISENTGRAKTIHVQGYYRKDGTYVKGHYRSKPKN